jgi:hypothetical protein
VWAGRPLPPCWAQPLPPEPSPVLGAAPSPGAFPRAGRSPFPRPLPHRASRGGRGERIMKVPVGLHCARRDRTASTRLHVHAENVRTPMREPDERGCAGTAEHERAQRTPVRPPRAASASPRRKTFAPVHRPGVYLHQLIKNDRGIRPVDVVATDPAKAWCQGAKSCLETRPGKMRARTTTCCRMGVCPPIPGGFFRFRGR